MTETNTAKVAGTEPVSDPLAKLREPFPAHHISKLPKESRAQIDERKTDRRAGISCQVCGGWHHKNAVHLDYVGHAALTDRLLDTDTHWSWEPVAFGPDGLPALDRNGGLWIRLTVCGMTRLGYGHADGKTGGDAIKEAIGDALRNAAMRFGAALDLWHKGELHLEEAPPEPKKDLGPAPLGEDFPGANGKGKSSYQAKKDGTSERFQDLRNEIWGLESDGACVAWANARAEEIKTFPEAWRKQLREELDEQRRLIAEQEAGGELEAAE